MKITANTQKTTAGTQKTTTGTRETTHNTQITTTYTQKTTANTYKPPSMKALALTICVALALAGLLGALGSTLASSSDIEITLAPDPGIDGSTFVEVGQVKSMTVYNLKQAQNSNTSIASMNYTADAAGVSGKIYVNGIKAGATVVAYGTSIGAVSAKKYHITDSRNISAYKIKSGGEVVFSGPGKTKNSPVEVITGTNNIEWRSMNPAVATVNANTGAITAVKKGIAAVQGAFTDKWGVKRNIHILVDVGIMPSDEDLYRLLELINQGEKILALDPNPNSHKYLDNLQDAVNNGKDVIDSDDHDREIIQDAIVKLENALKGIDDRPLQPGDVIGPDSSGNYYKVLGEPPNVYEVVDEDGNSRTPPSYVYNEDGDPVNGYNRDAILKDGAFYVEDPEDSNIWKQVYPDGNLKDTPAIWGGPDGLFGTSDDKTAELFDDKNYWVHIGQNVWQKVDGKESGELTGGGPAKNPAVSPATPIFKHDGIYYIGPLGTAPDDYYIGDGPGGNGLLDSTEDALTGDDVIYYLVNGQMNTQKTVMPPYTTTITITPPVSLPANSVEKGDIVSFSASVKYTDAPAGTPPPAQTVVWTVSGNNSSKTSFNGNKLTVASGETAETITIRATSTVYSTVYATVNITLYSVSLPTNIYNLSASASVYSEVTIDSIKWIVLKNLNSGTKKYMLLLRKSPVAGSYSGFDSKYATSSSPDSGLRGKFRSLNNELLRGDLAKLAVVADLGNDSTSAISNPSSAMAANVPGAKDVFFPLSYSEANDYGYGGGGAENIRLFMAEGDWWLRTPVSTTWYYVQSWYSYTSGQYVGTISKMSETMNPGSIKLRPAVWVRYM